LNKKLQTALNTTLFLGLGIALLYWALSQQDLNGVMDEIKAANPLWLSLAILSAVLSHYIRAIRWNLLLEPLDMKAKASSSFSAVIIGYLVNLALPRVGEIARPAALSKTDKLPFNKLVGTIVVERVVDLAITILMAFAIFLIQFDTIADFVQEQIATIQQGNPGVLAIIVVVSLIILVALYIFRKKIYQLPLINKFQDFIEGIIDGFKSIFNLKRPVLFIVYSLMIWIMYFLMPFLMLYAFDATSHLGVSAALTILFFGTAAMVIPVPGGVGTYEVLVPAALALYGITGIDATSYTLATHALQFISIIGLGVFAIIYFVLNSKAHKNDME
jgi:uncharacterized protein (TIRG00374 family)